MTSWHDLFSNVVLWNALLSWLIAQLLKVIIDIAKRRQFDATRLVGTGGMPSSHTALVVSLCTALGIKIGVAAPEFAVAVIFSTVVMYDATGIRRAAGRQAATINRIIKELLVGHPLKQTTLKELLGHTPYEVFGGAVLGIAIPIITHLAGWL